MIEFCVLALTAVALIGLVFPDDAGRWLGRVARAYYKERDR